MKKFSLGLLFCLVVLDGWSELKSQKKVQTEIRKQYYENGNIKIEKSFIKNTNTKHGKVIEYYENGKIKSKETYKNGKEHGESIYYYENGEIGAKKTYKDGVRIK